MLKSLVSKYLDYICALQNNDRDAGLNMKAHTKYISVYYLSWIAKDTIIELGMICACILALYQISNGAPIGNFVMLVAYWGNFTGGLLLCQRLIRRVG